MNFIYSCAILCISIFFNALPTNAMEDKDKDKDKEALCLFKSNDGRLIEWIPVERAPQKVSTFSSPEINQDYRSHPDFQYFKDTFEKDFNLGKPLDEIQFQIGSCYYSGVRDYSGVRVERNLTHAAWWYHKSAMQKNTFALDMLKDLAQTDKNEGAILYLSLLKNQISLGTGNWESC